MTVFVENDEAAIGKQERRPRKTAMAPRNVSCFDVDRGERRRPKIAARSVDQIADANRVGEMNSHQAVGPYLFDSGLVTGAGEFEAAPLGIPITSREIAGRLNAAWPRLRVAHSLSWNAAFLYCSGYATPQWFGELLSSW